jgi:tetratricopeptide (TPR) repeat protein
VHQIRPQSAGWPRGTTVTVNAPAAGPASSPLQEAFIRLEEAEQLRQRRKLDKAQSICEGLLRRFPDYMGALHTLGLIHADKENYQRALDCLVRAVMLNPRSWTTLTALSGVYLRLGAKEMAAESLEQARRFKPRDSNVLVTLGEIYSEEREYERAAEAYRGALDVEPDLLAAAVGLGWTYSSLGRVAEAASIFQDLIAKGVRSVDALFALTSLPASVVSIDLLKQLDTVVKDENEDPAEFENTAAFARAAALSQAGQHGKAWETALAANRTEFGSKRKRTELDEEIHWQAASLTWLTQNSVSLMRGEKDSVPISLFILGPSRSGKTSMEYLVSMLDGVKRGYENPIVENAVRRSFQTAGLLTSDHIEFLPAQLHSLCHDIYLDELERRAGGAKVFTNTHPGRIHDAGRLAAIIPKTRFIFVKRNLDDIILRMYLRKYNRGNAHAYDLKHARDHVVWYHQMMDLLAQKIPDRVRIIQYEDMVADPAAALRVAAELCGLAMPDGPVPTIGDDRGCSEPYRELMAAEFAG